MLRNGTLVFRTPVTRYFVLPPYTGFWPTRSCPNLVEGAMSFLCVGRGLRYARLPHVLSQLELKYYVVLLS